MRYRHLALSGLFASSVAYAHVKWFEEYEVAQSPVPILTTLSLPYFWLGVALVLGFFVATSLLERQPPGIAVTHGLDKVSRPLRDHADAFMLAVLFAFFVALYAVGGSYLTPELKTDAEVIPWAQLVIALLVIARRTRPIAALAIVILWVVAMRSYDLFHLYDYLALGLGLAGYLLLSGVKDGPWHDRRFAVLRWGVALALMWSSMEKFMYPQWFLPLLEEKPFLAFGIPFGPYTTMAGVAEFTLGFGLLWTPLIRRLSALALFALMFSAVYPFGRVDMIGHATILAALLLIIANPPPDDRLEVAPRDRRATWWVPISLAIGLAVTMISFSGQHYLIYRMASGPLAALLRPESKRPPQMDADVAPGAFWRGQEHYHGAPTSADATTTTSMMEAMDAMQAEMNRTRMTGDVDRDFVAMMVPHHQSGVDMAKAYLASGKDPALRKLAEHIIEEQAAEIRLMRSRLDAADAENAPLAH